MTITDKQLAEWQALCDAATPGPWRNSKGGGVWANPNPNRGSVFVCEVGYKGGDAPFIASARTALPALIAEVRRLSEIVAAAEDRNLVYGTLHKPDAESLRILDEARAEYKARKVQEGKVKP